MKILTIALMAGAVASAFAQASTLAKATVDRSAGQANAAVLADFSKRVSAYAELRKNAERGTAQLEQHRDPAKIEAERLALAARIRTARAAAKVGDIFTLESRAVIKRLLSPQLKGAENKAAIRDDNPGAMKLKVNQPYPKDEPLSTVPPDILRVLPMLPADIEYRFVGKHLILYDNHSGLIVDYIPNAVP